jgi:hypothetical protein
MKHIKRGIIAVFLKSGEFKAPIKGGNGKRERG